MRCWIIIAVLGSPAALAAQEPPASIPDSRERRVEELAIGSRVRVVTLESPPVRLIGRFGGLSAGSLRVEAGNGVRTFPIGDVLRLDESYRYWKKGAILGVVAAAVGVYAWDFFGPHPKYADQGKRYRENVIALVVAGGAGAAIGSYVCCERWREVRLPR